MAKICYNFPIKHVHGQLEKDGIVFKSLGKTSFTSTYTKPGVPLTARQREVQSNFALIATHVAGYKKNADVLNDLRTAYSNQSTYKSFNKYLWSVAKSELGL